MGRPKLDDLTKRGKQICILLSQQDLEILKYVENHFNFNHNDVFHFGLDVLSSSLKKCAKSENKEK